ncbi:efflux transporter outer membrane subunit [Flavobacterium sp. NKUCC04_CG]|uniref:efflux transporter outer membrane subunit n=1 Tax=Flavobacterium sp. NKUCC04_CG TaxID=2842121 RepID=UPI001C5BB213|nr:efflux transporter outer membrane subunit [Flavobacterium sp. NKUCC04_CG]MBW3519096.1 efflux transporter outer membrane subunit [Flavobacterium sp. NKUCC04_CG]
MKSIINTLKLTAALSTGIIMLSCSVQKHQPLEPHFPQSFRTHSPQSDSMSIAPIHYKDFFKDTVLVALIDKAVKQNNDFQLALKQIEFASMTYKQSKWGNLPKIDATIGSASINRPAENNSGPSNGKKYQEDYNSTVNISWEADIWGKISGIKEQTLADYLITQEAAKAVKTRLVSEVATGYYNLLMLDKQLEISQENLSFAKQTNEILQKQYKLGMINSLAVQQQEMAIEQIVKTIPAIENAISVQENSLSALSGSMPDIVERKTGLDQVHHPESLASGIPAELLSNRPDVKSGELNFKKSIASIHIAKVSMYPSLNITAQGGLNALKTSNWFTLPGSLFGIATASLTQPILNGKQLKTQYEQAKINSEMAEIQFKQSVLNAVSEVSDALVAIEKLEQQQKIGESLVEKATKVVSNSVTLYQYAEATYLEVLLAQSNKLQSELDLAAIKTQRLNAITTLYRALGGGVQ